MQKPRKKPRFWQNPGYWLYHVWGELYTRWHENFDRKWREPLPSIPCQFCGGTDHKEAYCPNLRKVGFIQDDAESNPDSSPAKEFD
jgi:hypothetical protein